MLNLWHTFNPEETKTLNTLLDQVRREHPGWKIQSTVIPFARAQNEFRRAAEGCTVGGPDLLRAELPWVPELAGKALIRPVPSDAVDRSDYLPVARTAAEFDGKWWILPASLDCLALLYNRSRLPEAPKTIEEFIETSRKLTRDGKGHNAASPDFDATATVHWGFYVRHDAYWFLPFLWAQGGRLLDPKSGAVYIDRDKAVAALSLYRSLIDTHRVAPPRPSPANDYEDMMQRFGKGEVAMIVNGPWATADLLARPAFQNVDNLGIGPFPNGASGRPAAPASGHGYLVSRCTKQPKQAFALARVLSDAKAQGLFAEKNSLLPARVSVYHQPEVRTNRFVRLFKAALDRTRARPKHPAMARIFDDFTPAIRATLLGDATAKEALSGVAVAWRKLLSGAAASGKGAAPAQKKAPSAEQP